MARQSRKARLAEHLFDFGGFQFGTPAAPWCDCDKPTWTGQTRREDNVWVRACCMRRTKYMYDKYGDEPVPPVVPSGEQIGATT